MSGVGIDLLEIERLERALERRPRLAERLFTDAERGLRGRRGRGPAMHLAARFCAKEAVAKALGLTRWSFRDVEVVATDAAPELRPERRARPPGPRSSACALAISLTHTDTTAGGGAPLLRVLAGDGAARPGSTRSTRPPRCAPSTRGRSRSRACPRST